MSGQVVSIFRHPVKGFTPEPLAAVDLTTEEGLAFDRVYAVENGPSGFDAAAPAFVPKQKFTVLAAIPALALARTAFDGETSMLSARAPGLPDFSGRLDRHEGREAFAAWLALLIGEEARGLLRVVAAPRHRFTDHPLGQVSIINLASVRDLERRVGRPIDPLRFRANLHVEGWPAWAETEWTGRTLALGAARAKVFKSIVRCAAVNVDPGTGVRDMDLTKSLFDSYGHMNCGVYVQVERPGRVAVGQACIPAPEESSA